jgi:hypothetical protein
MKNSKQCTSLPEQVEESLQTSFWDTDQSLLSSGTNTLVKSSEPESQTDGLTECQCGKETLDCLIHPNTKDEWIAFMQDSLAQIFQRQDVKKVLEKTRDLDFTVKSYGLPMTLDLNTFSWKMSQESYQETKEKFSEQLLEMLPKEATIVSGVVYPLPKLGQIIKETDGGSWPTPRVADTEGGIVKNVEYKNGSYSRVNKKGIRFGVKLKDALGGKPNPRWTEWLMGWPIGHLKLER